MLVMDRWNQALLTVAEKPEVQPLQLEANTGTVPHADYRQDDGNESEDFYSLVKLDRPAWWQLLRERGFPITEIHRFDDLIADWLSQADYHRLLELARAPQSQVAEDEVEDLFDHWIDEKCGARLIRLIDSMGYWPRTYPGCYAIASAVRSVQSVLEYVRRDHDFHGDEIDAMVSYFQDSSAADDEKPLPYGW